MQSSLVQIRGHVPVHPRCPESFMTFGVGQRIRRRKNLSAANPFHDPSRQDQQRGHDPSPLRSERTTGMQRLTLVRYAAKPDRADENEALARAVHAELRAMTPTGLAYLLFRNNAEFVHLFVNAREDDAEALTSLPAFQA